MFKELIGTSPESTVSQHHQPFDTPVVTIDLTGANSLLKTPQNNMFSSVNKVKKYIKLNKIIRKSYKHLQKNFFLMNFQLCIENKLYQTRRQPKERGLNKRETDTSPHIRQWSDEPRGAPTVTR